MFGIGWSEVLIILVVALLVLGPTKLPEIARGLAKGLREFRRAMSTLEEEDELAPRRASYAVEETSKTPSERLDKLEEKDTPRSEA